MFVVAGGLVHFQFIPRIIASLAFNRSCSSGGGLLYLNPVQALRPTESCPYPGFPASEREKWPTAADGRNTHRHLSLGCACLRWPGTDERRKP